jgi:hypothetical protein
LDIALVRTGIVVTIVATVIIETKVTKIRNFKALKNVRITECKFEMRRWQGTHMETAWNALLISF